MAAFIDGRSYCCWGSLAKARTREESELTPCRVQQRILLNQDLRAGEGSAGDAGLSGAWSQPKAWDTSSLSRPVLSWALTKWLSVSAVSSPPERETACVAAGNNRSPDSWLAASTRAVWHWHQSQPMGIDWFICIWRPCQKRTQRTGIRHYVWSAEPELMFRSRISCHSHVSTPQLFPEAFPRLG